VALGEAKVAPVLTVGRAPRRGRRRRFRAAKLGDRAQNFAAMTERSDTEVFQVLVCQIPENREIDIVVSKALGVLGHSEFFEPISNLLHRRL